MSRQLLLLRHGRTAFNAAGRFQGQVDVPLDDEGRAQAAQVGPLIASRNPVQVISSDSSRAADTAAAVADAAGLTLTFDERLREIDVGGWSGRTLDQVEVEFTQEYKDWISGNRCAAGEGRRTPRSASARTSASGGCWTDRRRSWWSP